MRNSNTGPSQGVLRLMFEPDLVIQWRTPGDTQEDFWYQKNLIRDEEGKILRADPRYVNGHFDTWEWLTNHSAIAKYWNVKILRTVEKIRVLGLWGYLRTRLRGERAKVAIARLKTAEGSAALPEYDRFFLYRESATVERLKPYWMESAQYVLMMRDLLAGRGIPFARGYLPLGMIVGPDQWAEGRVAWGFEKEKTYDARVALAIYEQFSQEARIPFINPLESFRKAAKTEKLFYDHDGHFTPAGHRVVADYLARAPEFQVFLEQRLR